jgi:diketogulonate reductase-like aldo/keto reductase
MQTTITLNNEIKIPQVGLGVFRATDSEAQTAVTWALETGYRHIDTAKIYGNEAGVGRAIADSRIPREEIFITTKLWTEDIRQKHVKAAFEKSLTALHTNYINLYLIHWPAAGFADAWQVMEELYQQGKIRAIGVSNFHTHHLEELAKVQTIKPAVNQIESHPYFSNQKLIEDCQTAGIPVEVWSPLGGKAAMPLVDPVIVALAEKYQRTPAQIIIRWHMQRGVIVLPKSVHRERIISNFNVFDFQLTPEDMQSINALNRNQRVGSDPDHFDF